MTHEEKLALRRAKYAQNIEGMKAYRADYYKRTGNARFKRYEKTKKGFLMRAYRNMQSRILGIQKKKHHLYAGKSLLPREDFYAWANASNSFHHLFAEWETADHSRKLTPSVNRIDAEKGYEIGNLEWITHSENSRKTRRWLNHHKI